MIKKPSPYAFFLIFAWLTIIFTSDAIGKIEGKVFPVVSAIDYSIVSKNDNETIIHGSFEKYRKCSFEKIKWKVQDEDLLSVEIGVSFNNQVIIRKEGTQSFYNWKLYNGGLNLKNSEIYVYHVCHPFWDTITKM